MLRVDVRIPPVTTVLSIMAVVCVYAAVGLWPAHAADYQQSGEQLGQEVTGPDGAMMVWVPAGTFERGSHLYGRKGHENIISFNAWMEYPPHEVQLDGLWIQSTEVTNARYAAFLNAYGDHSDSEGRRLMKLGDKYCGIVKEDGQYRPKKGRGDHAAVTVTWLGARTYARHHGLKLPTGAEWEYAASGPDNFMYPWGDDFDPDRLCFFGNQQDYSGARTYPVASFPKGKSWCGAFDMAGNVWEWIRDGLVWNYKQYSKNAPVQNPFHPPSEARNRVCRGGGWGSAAFYCRCSWRMKGGPDAGWDGKNPGYSHYSGFRCAYMPSASK